MAGIFNKHLQRPRRGKFNLTLTAILAVWFFCLSGFIHILHTNSSFRIIDCQTNKCVPSEHIETNKGDSDHNHRGHLVYPFRSIHNKSCPACDFLSKSKSEHPHNGPDIAPRLEIYQNSGLLVEISIVTAPPRPVFPRAPPA